MKKLKNLSIFKKGLAFILFWICTFSVLFSQTITVKGTVRDITNDPLIGVTLQVIEATTDTKGTTTDVSGNFTLTNISPNARLRVSYVGMKTRIVEVNGRTSLNIILDEDQELLEEVIIHGYGNLTRDEETSSIASIKVEEMAKERHIVSVSDLIQGQAAGVQIVNNAGLPGSEITFNIRGVGSFSTHSPLVVIDGVIIDGGSYSGGSTGGDISEVSVSPFLGNSSLANLNPNDIASIEILKDASATAIYGSRASNGVVLITTKEGVPGKNKIEYNFNLSSTKLTRQYDLLGSREYMDYYNEAYATEEERGTLSPNTNYPYPEKAYEENLLINTNWQDQVFQTALSMDHQLSISGGDKIAQYLISGGYTNLEGIIKTSKMERYSTRFNYNRMLSDKVRMIVNLTYTDTENHAVPHSVPAAANQAALSVISSALSRQPFNRDFTEDDLYRFEDDINNPLALIYGKKDVYRSKNLLGRLNLSYEPIQGLIFRMNTSYTGRINTRDTYFGRSTVTGKNAPNGYAMLWDNEVNTYIGEYTATYNRRLTSKSRMNLVTGFTWQETTGRAKSISATDFPSDDLLYYNLSLANSVRKPVTSFSPESKLASFIGRAVYSHSGKYVLAFSGRYDGSSRLAPGNRWNFFPSFSGAWNMERENFIRRYNLFSQMKIRASVGTTGSQAIGAGSSQEIYSATPGAFGNNVIVGYIPGRFANPNLKWERTYQWNVGVDLGIMRDRVKFTANYYNRESIDLIGSVPIPASTGYGSYRGNMGKIRNNGLEFEGSAQIFEVTKNTPGWDISANISFNRNKILSLGDVQERGASRNYFGSVTTHRSREGGPMYMFEGYLVEGVYQTQEEADAGPRDEAAPINYPGAHKFVDTNGDGYINTADLVELGSPFPDYIFGITNIFTYKNFQLSAFINGSVGNKIANLTRYRMDGLVATNRWNTSREAYENAWRGEGTTNTYTRPVLTANQPYNGRFTNLILEDGTYVRLKNVTISYQIPLTRLGIDFASSAKVFATGTNLITITNYSGYDPEVSGAGSTSPGVDFYTAPQGKTFTFGLNIIL